MIVIVGRPNVGKSSIFNRIIGSRKAIVESASGTTRDRLYADIKWKGKEFTIVDTGGFDTVRGRDMTALILKQLYAAIDQADIIFFVTDATVGILPQDIEFSNRLRKTSKRIYLIANKVDDKSQTDKAMEFFELGIGSPYAVSAMNGIGIEKLLDDVTRSIAKPEPSDSTARPVSVAVVGRPNVGKSSYINSIFKEDRVIVHPVAGTTRDAVDTELVYKDRDYLLIDTAGIRHNTKINESADFYGSVRSKEAVKRCDAAIVLIDGFDGLREDDERIIDLVITEGKALIVAVNKWDLTTGMEMSKYGDMLIKKMSVLKNYPIIFMSCKTGRNVTDSLDLVWSIYERSRVPVKDDDLAETLRSLNNAPEVKNKKIKLLSLVQEGTTPPAFVFGTKYPGSVTENSKRYIENFFRKSYNYEGVPIRIRYDRMKPVRNK